MSSKKSLRIGWLYPELMSTYGDRGNIIVLQKRCEWRGIKVEILKLDLNFNPDFLKKCDFLFMGGAQDQQQKIVSADLMNKSVKFREIIENGIPGLYICGAYQFLGKYYKEADGKIINGLGIFDLYTENPGIGFSRLIGDLATRVLISQNHQILVGFENHGGRTYIGKNIKPMGKVIKGQGNNGNDGTEGAIYKNSFGSYLHGPIFPKNPQFADHLIKLSLEKKYKKTIDLSPLDDSLEELARNSIAKKLSIDYNE